LQASFNLIDQGWIHCELPNGRIENLGLLEVLANADEIIDIRTDFPTQYVGIFRVLLAILHRNFGPRGSEDWQTLWKAKAFDNNQLENYFHEWANRFDLFDKDTPFYQTKEITSEAKAINDFTFHLAMFQISKGNTTLFNHHTDTEEISWQPDEAAIQLVTAQSFGIGFRQFKDGPSARGVNYILKGKNLFSSLLFNLIRYDKESNHPFTSSELDRPAWEQNKPFEPDRNKPLGYLDYLTWQSRKVLLIPDNNQGLVKKVMVDVGLRLSITTEPFCFNPMWVYRENQKPTENSSPYIPNKFFEGRALWRESTTLLNTFKSLYKPLAAIEWLNQVGAQENELRISALGMASDQGKVNFFMEELFVCPSEYLSRGELVGDLETCLDQAGQVRDKLWGAVNHMAEIFLAPESDLTESHKPDKKDLKDLWEHLFTEGIYWAGLELPFYALVTNLPKDEDKSILAWQTSLKDISRAVLEQAQNSLGSSPKALKAAAQSKSWLEGGLTKVFPN
jgi:CRISPR system Cascade subunit CasA